MLEIIEIHERCPEIRGMLQPFVCTASDGNQYYCKGSNAQVNGLLNEWICAYLGQHLGLPVPAFHVLSLDDALRNLLPIGWQSDLKYTCLFGLQAVRGAETLSISRVDQVSTQLQKSILLFDGWCQNLDRVLTAAGGNVNLLLEVLTNQLWVIDHNLAFDTKFCRQDFIQYHVFSGVLEQRLLDKVDLVHFSEACSEAMKALIADLSHLPTDWLEADPNSGSELEQKISVLMQCEECHFLEWLL